MPVIAFSLGPMAIVARMTRVNLLETLSAEHVRLARARGIPTRLIVRRYVLKNASIPMITVLLPLIPDLLTGSIFIEAVFSVPGLGRFFTTSALTRDYPMIMAMAMMIALLWGLMYLHLGRALRHHRPARPPRGQGRRVSRRMNEPRACRCRRAGRGRSHAAPGREGARASCPRPRAGSSPTACRCSDSIVVAADPGRGRLRRRPGAVPARLRGLHGDARGPQPGASLGTDASGRDFLTPGPARRPDLDARRLAGAAAGGAASASRWAPSPAGAAAGSTRCSCGSSRS